MSLELTLTRGIARLTIDRPQARNALDGPTLSAIESALDQLEVEPGLRAVVLTGRGDRVFCAGADLRAMSSSGDGPAEAARRFAKVVARLHSFSRPVVARVNGDVLGGGVGLLLAADLAIATSTSTLSLPEARVGLWPMMVGAILLRELPRKLALELALTSRKLSMAEAASYGLINRVVDPAELDVALDDLLSALLRAGPAATRIGRAAWRDCGALPVEEGLLALADRLGDLLQTEDAAEGMVAFLQKREPEWRDR